MMGLIRYLYRSINLLNIALLIPCVLLTTWVVSPYFYGGPNYRVPTVKLPPVEEETTVENVSPPTVDYAMVAEQNLFHPERRIPPEKKAAQELPKPELILYGTFMSDGVNVAYIEDKKAPATTPGRGKRQTVLKKGDTVSGFVLKEIEADKIVLVRGEESMVVHLSQGDKPRTSDLPPAGGVGAKPVPVPTPVVKPVPATPLPGPLPGVTQPMMPQRSVAPPMPGGGRRSLLRGATPNQEPN